MRTGMLFTVLTKRQSMAKQDKGKRGLTCGKVTREHMVNTGCFTQLSTQTSHSPVFGETTDCIFTQIKPCLVSRQEWGELSASSSEPGLH